MFAFAWKENKCTNVELSIADVQVHKHFSRQLKQLIDDTTFLFH